MMYFIKNTYFQACNVIFHHSCNHFWQNKYIIYRRKVTMKASRLFNSCFEELNIEVNIYPQKKKKNIQLYDQ